MQHDEATGETVRSGASRWLLLLIPLAFVGGAGAMAWLATSWNGWPAATTSSPKPAPPSAPLVAAQPVRPLLPAEATILSGRVGDLEARLSRITLEAQAASDNAARAEGLLVAFAARRALDSGQKLGYIEGQLRLRFGEAQPRAVATIINAANEPVTLPDLQAELDALAPRLAAPAPDAGWWQRARNQLGSLIVIRKTTTPSPQPEQRLLRARRFLSAGEVDAALVEVNRMPGRVSADAWMQMARRYNEARRALDVIETAAILAQRPPSAVAVTEAP